MSAAVVWNFRGASASLCLCLMVFALAADEVSIAGDDDVQEVEVQSVNRSATFMAMPESMMVDSDLQCLQELPLGQLLKIRKSLSVVSHMMGPSAGNRINGTDLEDPLSRGYVTEDGGYVGGDGYAFDFNHTDRANAQPLMMETIKDKVGYDDGWVEEKPSKIQKIFQFSVTTLAFLAFGGYLLCMIVQAIKSKGTTYYHPTLLPMTTATATAGNLSIKKRRPVRMRRSPTDHTKNTTRNQTDQIYYRKSGGPSPDDLYNVLVLAAEGFVNLGQLK